MTYENKELLIKDLGARFLHRVKCNVYGKTGVLVGLKDYECAYIATINLGAGKDTTCEIEFCKPYLRSLSSMTEEEKIEYNSLCDSIPSYHYEYGDVVEDTVLFDNFESFDWLNAHYFDYRGLIWRGLAIDATNLSIY